MNHNERNWKDGQKQQEPKICCVFGLWIMQFSFNNSSFNFRFVLDTHNTLKEEILTFFFEQQKTIRSICFIHFSFFSQKFNGKNFQLKTVLQQNKRRR